MTNHAKPVLKIPSSVKVIENNMCDGDETHDSGRYELKAVKSTKDHLLNFQSGHSKELPHCINVHHLALYLR